jgi:GTP-binding protein HflX
VELAQLTYRLPRLKGRGTELSRLGGGIGTRGPGEKKLEVDRRRILDRISFLKGKLERIERSKRVQRKRRQNVFKLSLVGYTNTGKSTVMNLLTHSRVLVEDKLFATLDATTRVLPVQEVSARVLLSDTVGFIEDLPPELVASFHATLGVVKEADLLLHVIDLSHPRCAERIGVVDEALEEIGCHEIPRIRVFNKIDLLVNRSMTSRIAETYPDAVFISARTEDGIPELKRAIEGRVVEVLGDRHERIDRDSHV